MHHSTIVKTTTNHTPQTRDRVFNNPTTTNTKPNPHCKQHGRKNKLPHITTTKKVEREKLEHKSWKRKVKKKNPKLKTES